MHCVSLFRSSSLARGDAMVVRHARHTAALEQTTQHWVVSEGSLCSQLLGCETERLGRAQLDLLNVEPIGARRALGVASLSTTRRVRNRQDSRC